MGYSMFVGGELTLPPAVWDRFHATPVDPSRRAGSPGVLDRPGSGVRTVGELLAWLPEHVIGDAGSMLQLEQDADRGILRCSGVMVEDDVLDHASSLAELFHLGAELGGTGTLYLLEEQVLFHPQAPELCYVVRATPGSSVAEHVAEDEQLAAIQGPLFATFREQIAALMDG